MATASAVEIKRAADSAAAASELKAIRERLDRIEQKLDALLRAQQAADSKIEAAWKAAQARAPK